MSSIIFVTHPEVVINPLRPIPKWPLSELGRARMEQFAESLANLNVTRVYASHEVKSIDGAQIAANRLGLYVTLDRYLGENDRSSTGYIAPPEFREVVAEFFARPTRSILGWERASNAQKRIVAAVTRIAQREDKGDILIVSHGAVGCLLTAHLQGVAIGKESRPSHPGGGCFLVIDREPIALRHVWRTIEDGLPP